MQIRDFKVEKVVNQDAIGRLPLRMVVPITDWKPVYAAYAWFVFLPAAPSNGLIKDSGADTFQTKSVSLRRLVRRLHLSATDAELTLGILRQIFWKLVSAKTPLP